MTVHAEYNHDASPIHINGVESQWQRRPSQRDMVLEHLRKHGAITHEQAAEFGCATLPAVISNIRRTEGLDIEPDRGTGRGRATYRLVEWTPAGMMELAEPSAREVYIEELPAPEAERTPDDREAVPADSVTTLAVVMDNGQPVLVIENASFRLTRQQMRFIATNMALFAGINEVE